MRILLTGSKGQLGRELTKRLQGHDLILTDVEELDITNAAQVYSFMNENRPEIVINCAAHTNVDKCESDIDNAFKINAIGAKNLAAASYNIGAEIVQVSTDYVFSGDGHLPYTEFDETNPNTVYGKSKLAGEVLVKELNPRHYIVRTAWLYGEGNNFVKTMLNLAKNNTKIKVVNDQFGTPTSTADLASVILELVKSKNYGLFHCTCKGQCSWYEFAREIFKIKNIPVEVVPCTTTEFPRAAKRPSFSVLKNFMLELTTGDITREWQDSLKEYLEKIE